MIPNLHVITSDMQTSYTSLTNPSNKLTDHFSFLGLSFYRTNHPNARPQLISNAHCVLIQPNYVTGFAMEKSNQVTTRTNEQASGSNNNRHETYDEQRDSLNTRTMFFQPPPSYRRPTQPPKSQEAASNKQLDSTTSPHQTTTNTNYVTEGGGGESKPTDSNRRQQQQPPGDKSDTNEPVLFGTAAKTNGLDQQPPARQESSFAFQQTSSSASPLSAPPATLSNSYNGQGHRRGTIIASATTSPSRGHYNVRMAHSSSLQNHKPKVSSSSSSPAYRLWSPNDLWWLVSTSLYAVVVMIIMMEESRVTQTASDLLH